MISKCGNLAKSKKKKNLKKIIPLKPSMTDIDKFLHRDVT